MLFTYVIHTLAEYWLDLFISNEGGWATKRAPSYVYIILSTYTGKNFGLLNYLTKVKNYGKDRLNQSKTGVC